MATEDIGSWFPLPVLPLKTLVLCLCTLYKLCLPAALGASYKQTMVNIYHSKMTAQKRKGKFWVFQSRSQLLTCSCSGYFNFTPSNTTSVAHFLRLQLLSPPPSSIWFMNFHTLPHLIKHQKYNFWNKPNSFSTEDWSVIVRKDLNMWFSTPRTLAKFQTTWEGEGRTRHFHTSCSTCSPEFLKINLIQKSKGSISQLRRLV